MHRKQGVSAVKGAAIYFIERMKFDSVKLLNPKQKKILGSGVSLFPKILLICLTYMVVQLIQAEILDQVKPN